MKSPFRYFKTSPEVIRLPAMDEALKAAGVASRRSAALFEGGEGFGGAGHGADQGPKPRPLLTYC